MKATMLLRKDHDEIRTLLMRARKGSGADKASHVEELREAVRMHFKIEEDMFFPELLNTPSNEVEAQVNTAVERRRRIEKLLEGIAADTPARRLETQVATLEAQLEEHFRFEEEVFETARLSFSEFRMEQLGLEMEERRRFLRRPAA